MTIVIAQADQLIELNFLSRGNIFCLNSSHSNTDPEPAMASRWQHEKRSFQLEFQAFSTQFNPD